MWGISWLDIYYMHEYFIKCTIIIIIIFLDYVFMR